MRSRILVIPAVSELHSFSRLIAHIGHYLGHLNAERVAVLVEPGVLREAEAWLRSPALPPGYGDRVVGRIEAVRERIALITWPQDLDVLEQTSDLVLDWDVGRSEDDPWATLKPRYRLDRTLFSIDWQGIRLGAARLADAARIVGQGRQFDRSQAAAFSRLAERLGRAPFAYLVGTGPSARRALDHDLSDGVRIVCNTVVLDDELMAHVRPDILAFADPIFHFGPSTYAQRFQEAVVAQAAKHEFAIVTTERNVPLLRAHAPEIAERVIGLRQGNASWPDNLDLRAHPAVRPYPNVLTMLMLPVAATMARQIALIGFDGRDPRDDYFWRHGSTVQLDQELKDIRLVHPGFFDLDYANYYDEHIAATERLFASLEERGTGIRPMTESYIPALRRRAIPPVMGEPDRTEASQPTLVSLTPDWISDFGHFGPFERRVHQVAEANGHRHVALTSAGLQPTADWQVPTFSEATLSPSRRFAPVGRKFEGELRAALRQRTLGSDAVVFLYTADVWHLPALLAVAVDHPEARFVVNLMRSHDWLDRALDDPDPWIQSLLDLVKGCLAAASRSNVEVAVDSEALARDVELLTGHAVRVWPMIVLSGLSQASGQRTTSGGAPHVVAPVQAQGGKGFPELTALAELMYRRLERGELQLTARWPAAGLGGDMVRLAERFEERGGRLVRGNLSDEAFVELVASADVALIPYRIRPFRTRTSAVTIEALMAGKPVVAVRGTWGGDLVDRYGAGLTYADGDVAAMDRALSEVISRLDTFRDRVAEIRNVVAAEHAPERLLDFLRDQRRTARTDAQVAAEIANLQERANHMRRLFQWHAKAEDSIRMAAVIREDDQQRSIDTWRDQVDSLKRATGQWSGGKIAMGRTQGPKEQGRAASGGNRRSAARRRALRRAARGSLRVALVASGLLALLAGALGVTGYVVLAILALALAVVTSVAASLVVAVRLERRL